MQDTYRKIPARKVNKRRVEKEKAGNERKYIISILFAAAQQYLDLSDKEMN